MIVRALIAMIVILYLVGVGVALSPTIRAKWNSVPASDLATSVSEDLPYARVAGEGLPQHNRPWLTALDGGAPLPRLSLVRHSQSGVRQHSLPLASGLAANQRPRRVMDENGPSNPCADRMAPTPHMRF